MVESVREAVSDMQDAMSGFFEETLMDAKNWKEAFISFLTDIQRAM
ncbi:unnamed protein product, partial [marine sediment metagenome]